MAVLLVVLMHSGLPISPGDGGVTMFFCVSGYIITAIVIRERSDTRGFDAKGFYWRRLLKLAPPLLLFIVAPSLIYAYFSEVNFPALLSQLLFSYNWIQVLDPQAASLVLPGSTVVWSLAVEEQFYIVFAILWALHIRFSESDLLVIAVAASIAVGSLSLRVALTVNDPSSIHAQRGTDARAEAIAYGVILAVVLHRYSQGRHPRLNVLASPWVIAVGFTTFFAASVVLRGGWIEPAFRPTMQALATILMLLPGLVPGEDTPIARAVNHLISLRSLQLIGLASYSIYLCHFPIIKLLDPLLGSAPTVFGISLKVASAVAIGILSYRFVEVPLQRYRSLVGRSGNTVT